MNKAPRKREKKSQNAKHKKANRFEFRDAMVRSLDELELGGNLPTHKELKPLFDSEEATIEFL